MKLSIVSSMYNVGKFVRPFYERVIAVAERITPDFEIIFVNDGSPDDSLAQALALHDRDPRVQVVDLSRNFGHHKAMMAGLGYAGGDEVFLIDCDLEEPPELLATFHGRLGQGDCDVVFGFKEKREGALIDRLGGKLFYAAINWFAEVKLPENLATVRLMTRRYVRQLLRHRDREMFIAGLWELTGFTQVGLPIRKTRTKRSSYSLVRKINLLIQSVAGFSAKPLVAIFYIGLLFTMAAVTYTGYLVCLAMFGSHPIEGWTSLMVSIWFNSGILTTFIGALGIYISKIHAEVKRRPYVVVRAVHRSRTDPAAQP